MSKDPYFGGPALLSCAQPLTTKDAQSPVAAKALQLHRIGTELRKLVENPTFALPAPHTVALGKPFGTLGAELRSFTF
jgi:hypothetical protein